MVVQRHIIIKMIFFGLILLMVFQTNSAKTTFDDIIVHNLSADLTTTKMYDNSSANITTTKISCDVPLTCNLTNFESTKRETNCLCDKDCGLYDECCPDAKIQTPSSKSEIPVFECVYLNYKWYYVVQSCPKSWNGTSESCELSKKKLSGDDIKLENIPVTNIVNNITYGNTFCAQCNGVAENDLAYWGMDLKCAFKLSDKEQLTSNMQSKSKMKLWSTEGGKNITSSCFSTLILPENIRPRLRVCRSNVIKNCSQNWIDTVVAERCSNYTSFAYYTDQNYRSFAYKNLDCAICNYRDPLNVTFCNEIVMQTEEQFSQVFKIDIKEGNCTCKDDGSQDGFVSITGVILSIIFIILHLIVFSLVDNLRNFSGKCVTSYACALMFGYIGYCLWEIASGSFCTFVAITTYYSFLAAFLWMFVMAYDVCVTIHGATYKLQYSTGKKEIRFLVYSILCWGIPLIFAISSLIVDSLSEDIFIPRPKFGQGGTCWFGSGNSLLFFFVLPCTIIITINILLFSWTSYLIFSNRKETSSRVKKEHGDFKLYGRLAILMGLTWTTGVIANYFQYDDLWVIFSLLNTTQGIFIFGAFSYKDKSIDVIKSRFSSSRVGTFLSGTTSTSVITNTELTTS